MQYVYRVSLHCAKLVVRDEHKQDGACTEAL
jgi:hypothetical protein